MKRHIQIGEVKELVEKNGWGEWKLHGCCGDWFATQIITTLRHRIVVGEFVIPSDAAVDLFNPDRDDGPFIVRIGGAEIEEPEGRLVMSETKKPAQPVVLPDGTILNDPSWIEFKDGQRLFAPVQIARRKDVPTPANRPRGTWWQRAMKKVDELPGKNKDERYDRLISFCEQRADDELRFKQESEWDIDYLPDDHRNKERNPKKRMIDFIRDWKTAKATTDGAREFRRLRKMWLMKQVERAHNKAGVGL